MIEELITFETAKLAKEKGFNLNNERCFTFYNRSKVLIKNATVPEKLYSDEYEAPTQSLLQKWLREVRNIDVEARPTRFAGDEKTSYYQPYINGCVFILKNFNTYEEALEIGLFEALKLIK